MYTLIRSVGFREALIAEGPSLLPSLFVAELFYKFHSFTLEGGAFLATWYAVSYVTYALRSRWRPRESALPQRS